MSCWSAAGDSFSAWRTTRGHRSPIEACTCRGPDLPIRSVSSEAVRRATLGGTRSCSASNRCSCLSRSKWNGYMGSPRTFPPSCRSCTRARSRTRLRSSAIVHRSATTRLNGASAAEHTASFTSWLSTCRPAIVSSLNCSRRTRSHPTSLITSSTDPLIGRPVIAACLLQPASRGQGRTPFWQAWPRSPDRCRRTQSYLTGPSSPRQAIGWFGGIIRQWAQQARCTLSMMWRISCTRPRLVACGGRQTCSSPTRGSRSTLNATSQTYSSPERDDQTPGVSNAEGGTSMGKLGKPNLLRDARVYLSGPMDFVASREAEKAFGWRNRVSEFLQELGVTVFDPWFKPEIQGVKEYGREDETTAKVRTQWSFDP